MIPDYLNALVHPVIAMLPPHTWEFFYFGYREPGKPLGIEPGIHKLKIRRIGRHCSHCGIKVVLYG